MGPAVSRCWGYVLTSKWITKQYVDRLSRGSVTQALLLLSVHIIFSPLVCHHASLVTKGLFTVTVARSFVTRWMRTVSMSGLLTSMFRTLGVCRRLVAEASMHGLK
jgi:hypothetical protein